jgi:hypothetical protein
MRIIKGLDLLINLIFSNMETKIVSYRGPEGLGSFDSAEPYLKYLEHLNLPKSEIKKVFADGNDVCVLHESNFATPPVTLFVCTWYCVDDGKISSIRIVFDPRPFVRETK